MLEKVTLVIPRSLQPPTKFVSLHGVAVTVPVQRASSFTNITLTFSAFFPLPCPPSPSPPTLYVSIFLFLSVKPIKSRYLFNPLGCPIHNLHLYLPSLSLLHLFPWLPLSFLSLFFLPSCPWRFSLTSNFLSYRPSANLFSTSFTLLTLMFHGVPFCKMMISVCPPLTALFAAIPLNPVMKRHALWSSVSGMFPTKLLTLLVLQTRPSTLFSSPLSNTSASSSSTDASMSPWFLYLTFRLVSLPLWRSLCSSRTHLWLGL